MGPAVIQVRSAELFKCSLYLLSPGELREIKQDLASLRCELLARGKHDKEALAKLIRQLGKVAYNLQKKEQKNQQMNPGSFLMD